MLLLQFCDISVCITGLTHDDDVVSDTVTVPYLIHSTSSWPESSFDELTSLLDQLRALSSQRKYSIASIQSRETAV